MCMYHSNQSVDVVGIASLMRVKYKIINYDLVLLSENMQLVGQYNLQRTCRFSAANQLAKINDVTETEY